MDQRLDQRSQYDKHDRNGHYNASMWPQPSVTPMTVAEPAAETGLILGRYRLLEQIGAGGYGTVQLAWDTRIQRRVAIKCIPLETVDEAADEDWPPFATEAPGLEEARTAALLNHPAIVSVYDFEIADDMAYLIMEYVDGLTLSQLMREAGDQFDLDMVAAVFNAVADALVFAHENQVLHLDIKPDNILIDHKGTVKVSDFGLSRLSDPHGYSAATGGTIGYMPPEQIMQDKLDGRCDEWALASLCYYLISGTNPFLARTLDKAIDVIEETEITLPSLCMAGFSSDADEILFFALDPDRNERYPTVEAFAQALEPYLGEGAVGKKKLAMVVDRARDDERAEETSFRRHRSHHGGLGLKAESILTRIWAVANAAVLGFISLSAISVVGGWSDPVSWLCLALVLGLAAFFPRVGLLLGPLLLAAALLWNGAFISGLAFILATGLWWFFVARRDALVANADLVPLLVGSMGFGQMTPLVVGLFSLPRAGCAGALYAGLLALVLSGFGSMSLLYWRVGSGEFSGASFEITLWQTVFSWQAWLIIASWIIAALLVSCLCLKGTRGFAMLGLVIGGVVLTLADALLVGLSTGGASWMPQLPYLLPTLISTGIMIIVGWLTYPASPASSRWRGAWQP